MPRFYLTFELEVESMRQVEEAKASLARLAGYSYKGTEMLGPNDKRIRVTQRMARRLANPNDPPREGVESQGLLDGV